MPAILKCSQRKAVTQLESPLRHRFGPQHQYLALQQRAAYPVCVSVGVAGKVVPCVGMTDVIFYTCFKMPES